MSYTLPLLLWLAVSTSPGAAPPPTRTPRLVLLVVVDQLRGDEIATYQPLWRDGVRRLVKEGRWYSNAMLDYARTETAAGHATIATGLPPRLHGVVDKRIFDATTATRRSVCDFDAPAECGPGALAAPTLGDRLKLARPQARVVALANKARSAALLGGRRADLVAWPDDQVPALQGRTATGALPDWLQLFYRQVAAPDRIAHLWELPPLPAVFAARDDDDPGEDGGPLGRTFPHRLPQRPARARYNAWQGTPDSDRALVELAKFVAQRLELARDAVPDLLMVSFSSLDTVGHEYGPDSVERAAALASLDRHVGELVTALAEQAGEGLLVALTSDHGVAPTLAQARRQGHESEHIDLRALVDAVETSLTRELGPGPHVATLDYPHLFLKPQPAAKRARAVSLAASALRAQRGVYGAWATDTLDGVADPVAQLLRNSAYPGRSGDVLVALKPYHAPAFGGPNALGANHGSPWPYDRHVPILLWGDGTEPGAVDTPVTVEALVRTLGGRLGVPPGPYDAEPLP